MVAPRAKSVSISKAAVSVKDWEIIADNLSEGGWSWGQLLVCLAFFRQVYR